MVFNSAEYLFFLAAVCFLHFALPHAWRWILLLVASYAFYMSWNASYAVLIAFSTVVDFVVGQKVHSASDRRTKKAWLLASLTTNLGLLFTFKYWSFFHESMAAVLGPLGVHYAVPELNVLLPVGISFYTFQTLSYTIDIYRGSLAPIRHFGHFALFVSFFPQLVAGPIERASRLLPQIPQEHRFSYERLCSGLQLVGFGLFKKVVIADRMSNYVDAVYGNVGQHDGLSFAIATYAFAFQIYCDFSGYSDIAIGSARMLGFDLMRNFEAPYFSRSTQEFWRRWHISLSTWLRDYLYISMGGNRHGTWSTYRNLLITMVLGGLWHGASWNFVIWGTLHGGWLAVGRATTAQRDRLWARSGAPAWLVAAWRCVFTFHLACFAWIFFRAETLADSLAIVRDIATNPGTLFVDTVTLGLGFGFAALLLGLEALREWRGSLQEQVANWPLPARWTAWYAMLACIVLFGTTGAQFIYFQF